jgi:type II secretory pathway pseudopilin PulG
MRPALTMIEIVFVIIILGIVSSIAADILSQTYLSYITQRAQYRASVKTELALNQIANRLRYAIPGTVGFRTSPTTAFTPITEINTGNDTVLQWVGYDGDGFEAIGGAASTGQARRPGWSGFCDINASSATTIVTPGSNLNLADTIIKNLGHSDGLNGAHIYFPDGNLTDYNISSGTGETLTLSGAIPSGGRIYERYKIAWSSYALSVEGGDLYLYYDFEPARGADLSRAKKQLLLKKVTNFRFKGSEGSIRIKLCKDEQIGYDSNATIHACKEKVVF